MSCVITPYSYYVQASMTGPSIHQEVRHCTLRLNTARSRISYQGTPRQRGGAEFGVSRLITLSSSDSGESDGIAWLVSRGVSTWQKRA